MSVAIRHRADPAPALRPVPGLVVRRVENAAALAVITGRDEAELRARLARGHRAYVASVDGVEAAWGWVATRRASIGELGLDFAVPEGERYLWNFVTWPPFRGRGIYPVLLDAVVRAESREAERFWIVYAPENHASARGIAKAGFTPAASLSFDAAGRAAVRHAAGVGEVAPFGAPEAASALAPCWRCARAGRPWPMTCPPGACECDYQVRDSGCHAEVAATAAATR